MSYVLRVDQYGMAVAKVGDIEFRAYCGASYAPLCDDTMVTVRVTVIENRVSRDIGWYNVDLFEYINLSYKGHMGELKSCDDMVGDWCQDQALWAIEFPAPSKGWVLTRFDKHTGEHLHLEEYEEHRGVILDMCRAQACKQTAKRIFAEIDSKDLLPVKYR